MKKIYYLILLLSSTIFSQTITVDDSGYTPSDLVTLLLGNSCTEVSNINVSSTQSVAYFNQNGSTFPISEGIIIRNGQAVLTQGLYNNTNLSTQINTNGDAYLQTISNNSGQSAGITDVAFLEFDFIPLSNNFSFNFLFASNEYGQYQCGFSDVFAFELINLSTSVSTNLAVIPGTSTPVTVKDIRNSANNPSCSSANPSFFGVYNVTNPPASTLNMRGHTIVMNASSAVIPNTSYRIRLVIGDYNDSGFDSAVFLAAGSFETTLDLGADQIICAGDSYTLDTNLDNTYTYQWFINGGPIAGATNSTYNVTQPGTYTVEITKGTCFITDTIIFNDLFVNNPIDLLTCDTGSASYSYDLTTNDENLLGINNAIYDIEYFESLADIASNSPIPTPNNYTSSGGQTIFIKILNTTTGNYCDAVYDFDLIVTTSVVAGTNITGSTCEDNLNYDLSIHDVEVINGQAGTYTITYFNSQAEAQSSTNPIGSNVTIPTGINSIIYWVRIEDSTNPSCFDVTSIDITVHPIPVVDTIPDVQECTSFTLPAITNGTYYLLPGGPTTPGQVQYNAGDLIDLGGTYYIFIGPDANGCTNESSFQLYFVDEYTPTLDNCGEFIIPDPPYGIGAFYTDFGGPNGTGTLIPIGTVFTNNTQATIIQTVYFYADVNGVPCRDEQFDINIHPIPLVDDPVDETHCNSYTLPALANGFYYTGSGGSGTQLFAGDVITTTQTIFVFNSNPNCSIENSFEVNIVDTTLFTSVSGCGSYTLPAITFGGYFDQPSGQGNSIDPSIPITTSQIVYYYTTTSVLPNCTDNLNYNITINPLPLVDTIASGVRCGEFILPTLTNGTYYTLSGGPSVLGQVQLNAGDIIDLSGVNLSPGTYYIFNGPDGNNCTNESNFTINLNAFPPIDGVLDRTECNPYSISTPTNGTIYTEIGGPNGSGVVVQPSDTFDYTHTFYIYNIDNATTCEIDRPFTITYSGINLPDYQDMFACEFENFTLPVLTHQAPTPFNYSIGYFYDPNGVNPVPNGTIFNTPNTQTTIYVYATNGDRIICNAEDSFVVTVSETPVLPNYTDIVRCGTYTLPTLPIGNFNVNYYTQTGGIGIINPSSYTFNTPGTYDIYVYATSIENINCNDEEHFQVTIYPLLDLIIPGGIICVDANDPSITISPLLLNSGLSPADFTVEWYLNGNLMGTGPTYLATTAGTYNVVTIKVLAENPPDCNYNPTTVLVEQSSSAIASVSISEPFENVAVITVNIDNGFGNYIYQLDNGAFQTSNQFYNVSSGEHVITVRDIFGYCGDFILTATVIKYPKYFTPNGDGSNETWNIFDLAIDHPESIISIFDRYGKLIKQISPNGIGWDGTYNGKKLPSTDYWFNVNYIYEGQEKIFRAHFSLIR